MGKLTCCSASPSRSWLAHLSADNLLPWAYPLVDCRPGFVNSGAPGRGCVYCFSGVRDGHLPRFHGHGGGPHVHDWPDHLDHRLQRLRRHNHGGGANPICIDYFPDTDINYDYAGSGSACTSTIIDHAGNSSTPSSLLGEETRQHRPDRLHRLARWQTLVYPSSSRFAPRAVYRAELERLQQIYSTYSSHPFSMVGYRSSGHFNS
jgi:hypothetical protein